MSNVKFSVEAIRVLHDDLFPCWSMVQLFLVATFCLKVFYEDVANRDVKHFAYISYMVMISNACTRWLIYTNNYSFDDLRLLLDYSQIILTAPLIVTEFLLLNKIVPQGVACIPAALAFFTLALYIALEYKREDLTDLNVIISVMVLCCVGYSYNIYAFFAGINFGLNYFLIRRTQYYFNMINQFNLLMSTFALLSLLSLDPDCINFDDGTGSILSFS